MAWQVTITQVPIVENGFIIIRSVLTDGVSQKIPDEYRSQSFDVADYKAYLNAKLAILNNPKQGTIDASLVPGVFDPTK